MGNIVVFDITTTSNYGIVVLIGRCKSNFSFCGLSDVHNLAKHFLLCHNKTQDISWCGVAGSMQEEVCPMKCPYCGEIESKVIDSRPADDGSRIRRRRECLSCQKRFTTYEIVETVPLMVVKKDHSREAFNRQKLLNGLLRACEKRPVSYEQLEKAVDNIEQNLLNSYEREVTSMHIGELAMQELKGIDEVAYVRFASVYRQFSDIDTFMNELSELLAKRSKHTKE